MILIKVHTFVLETADRLASGDVNTADFKNRLLVPARFARLECVRIRLLPVLLPVLGDSARRR